MSPVQHIETLAATPEQCRPKPAADNLGFGRHFSDHMFVMSYDDGCGWHSPKITPYAPFVVDPAAMVFHYGQAIFEGMKAYRLDDGGISLFRPRDNFRRMSASARRLCMPELPEAEVLDALRRLLYLDRDWVPATAGASLYIRPTMIAIEAALGVRPARQYLFFIITSPVGAYYPEGFNPTKIFVTDTYVRAVRGGVGHIKTAGNYAASIMAAVEAGREGYTQVLWLDAIERKYVEEVGTSNIFFVIGDELITPPLNGSILAGITRDSVLELARDWGLAVRERRISIDEVVASIKDGSLMEAFGTGTAAVISPVGELCFAGTKYPVNGGRTGPLAQRLFDTLQRIQYGREKEGHGWVLPVISKDNSLIS